MDYLHSTEISLRSFSQGRGSSNISPANEMSLDDIFDYLEEHPNDGFMHSHLDKLVSINGREVIFEAARRFKEKPTQITFGVLAQTNSEEYPEVLQALEKAADPGLLVSFFQEHYDIDVRGTLQHELLQIRGMWELLFIRNRTNHRAFSDMGAITLGIPADYLEALKNPRKYMHVEKSLMPFMIPSAKRSMNTGTSLRTVSCEDTYSRLDGLMSGPIIKDDNPLIGIGFCGTYAMMVPWDLELKASNGRNNYTLRGPMGCRGKGLEKGTAVVSGLMETIERISAGFGSTPDFPCGYGETQTIIKARQSQLKEEGNTLDLNSLSLKIPYQDQELHWVKGIEQTIEGANPINVPAQIVYMFSNLDEQHVFSSSSSGLASGNTMEEAKLDSLFEVIERDGDYTMFYSPERVFKLTASDSKIAEVLERYRKRRLTVQVLDLTSEFGIPTYRAFVQTNDQILSGSGTHLDGKIAVARAICELSPKCSAWEKQFPNVWTTVRNPSDDMKSASYESLPNYSTGNISDDLTLTEMTLLSSGFRLIYVNLTRSDFNIPVVRAIVPGLEIPEGTSIRQFKHFMEQSGAVIQSGAVVK